MVNCQVAINHSAFSFALCALGLLIVTSLRSVSSSSIDRQDMDENIAFDLPDLTVKVETPAGRQFQLEAFKSVNNDRILRDLQISGQQTISPTCMTTSAQLSWVTVGVPMFHEAPNAENATASRLFHSTKAGFYTLIQMLTPAHSKLLATTASTKYNVSVAEGQIVHLVLSSFECSIKLHDSAERTYLLKGEVTSFRDFPLRMDFKAPRSSIERRLFVEDLENGEDLDLACTMSSKGKLVKTNVLQINSQKLEQLALVEKLFGTGQTSDSAFVYVTRDQMASLSADMYSALNIIEDYQMPETQFSEAFVAELINQFASRQLDHVPIDEALRAISTCGLDIRGDLRADEIQRDLGEVLIIGKSTDRSKIVVNNTKKDNFDENFKLSAPILSKSWVIDTSVNFGLENSKKNEREIKPLPDQLTELNTASQNHIKWEIVGTKVVPKSLNVAKLINSKLSSTLTFNRVRVQEFNATFYRKFSLYTTHSRAAIESQWLGRTASMVDEELTRLQSLVQRLEVTEQELANREETCGGQLVEEISRQNEQMKIELLQHVNESFQQLTQQLNQKIDNDGIASKDRRQLANEDAGPGTPVLAHSSPGSGSVIAFAVLNDQLFVTRWSQAKVFVYHSKSLQLMHQLTFDGFGTGLYGLAACGTNNFLYVSDYNNRYIHRVDLPIIDNRVTDVGKWNGPGSPCGLSINRNRNVLVVYCELSKVIEYTPQGSVVREISDNSGSHLYQAVQLSSGAMAVSRYNPIHGVFTVSTNGRVINSYGNQPGSGVGRMNGPRCLAANDQDYILVADRDNHRILIVNPLLTEARELPLPANAALRKPRSLVLDQSSGRLYVGEEGNQNRLLVFTNITNIGAWFA